MPSVQELTPHHMGRVSELTYISSTTALELIYSETLQFSPEFILPLPSAVLRSLSTDCTAASLLWQLDSQLSVVLDTLPSNSDRTRVVSALSAVKTQTDSVGPKGRTYLAINYDTHERSLNKNVRLLYHDVKTRGLEGWEDQEVLMLRLTNEIANWIPELWSIGVELGFNVDLVRQSLVLCTDVIRSVQNCGSW